VRDTSAGLPRGTPFLRWSIGLIRQPFANRAGKPGRGYVGVPHLALPACVGRDKRCVDCGILVGDQPRVGAAPNRLLEQDAEDAGIAEAAMPVLAKRRVVRHPRVGRQSAEPAISEIEADFLTQPAFRRDAIEASDKRHADQQFRRYRGTPTATIMRRERIAQFTQVDQSVYPA
jgi:hypothetical protein